MAVTEDDVRQGLAALGVTPAEERLGAIAAGLEQNMAMVATVMAAPLRPRCENAPVWMLPPEEDE
ncbi:MAG: DUF4089 domain-containing protein [Rhodobacteraceae bacterium]|jgi:hypothetical protein|uniref:Putative DUF4089 protein n=1 Tax=Salipiger profundus TaxID=1229727 RepID=A0A1U7DCY9_9RHOB|nr:MULTISPECIES: AtzG-like protein [Salipiger]APX25930.1 putative DUF4089 protein [Salipiger profundus]MAB05048.1 DUF4089 domain-containing protein [Paracoccaceae bacterium]SFC83132.1 Protein of unknown function [Salipiger profundus]|tara:strand:- start:241 stop:435 length:195 start_codon:yes stop_codon:yes gene_type:complete